MSPTGKRDVHLIIGVRIVNMNILFDINERRQKPRE